MILPGLRFRVGDELLDRLRREVAPHQQHIRNRGHDRDRLERGRIVIQLLVKQAVDGERCRLCREQGIAVRLRRCDRFGADIAGLSAAIVDHNGLAEFLAQPLGDDARGCIHGAAGWHADDDLDRFVRDNCRARFVHAAAVAATQKKDHA